MLLIRHTPLLAPLFAAACATGDCPTIECPPRPDASSDADPDPDAGAGASADIDAGPVCDDASPCWQRMIDLPAGCDIERARRPERIQVTEFTGCGGGCLRGLLGQTWIPVRVAGWASEGARYLRFVGYPEEASSLAHQVIMRTDGVVVDALRHPLEVANDATACDTSGYAVGEGMTGFAVDYVEWETPDLARAAQSFIYRGTVGGLVDAPLVHTVQMPDVGGAQRIETLAISNRAVIWEIHGGGHLQAVVDGAFVDVGWSAFHSRVFGDHIIYEEQAGAVRLMHWTSETGLEPYLDVSPAMTAWFVSDGVDLAFVRLETRDSMYGELWTAPLVRDPAALAPRRVVQNVASSGLWIGDGLAAYEEVESARVVAHRVVDLATGEVRRWALPSGEVHEALFLISETELVVVTASVAESSRILYRIDPRRLPIVAP